MYESNSLTQEQRKAMDLSKQPRKTVRQSEVRAALFAPDLLA
jgi:hypothetical protein